MSNEERDLISEARQGHIPSFESLIRPHQAKLFRVILAVTANAEDAEDCLQESLLQAYKALPRFRGDAAFSTWLYRIALNTTRNWIRSESRASSKRYALSAMAPDAEQGPDIDEPMLATECRRFVREALVRLPEHYRNALLLRHYRGMTYDEIAAVQEVPVGTVRSRIAQARVLLARQLTVMGYLPPTDMR